MKTDILKKLVELYTEKTHPDVTTTVSQSLNQLSSGIYTEEERFIFELLQNAVDAYTYEGGTLSVKIAIKGEYLIFMHNGNPFSARDVEGLCDVGNGGKQKDIKKIGYKGIGFKSVFMCSSYVTVKSGDFCFKFDKDYWDGFWEKNWKAEYGDKNPDKKYLMPWQILPIKTIPPIDEDDYFYKVATYIKLNNLEAFEQKIKKLLSNSNFLLFLGINSIQVDFTINGKTIIHLSKKTDDEIVELRSRDKYSDKIDSLWVTYSNKAIPVPPSVADKLASDQNTPQKLKDAKSFDLSFAISVDGETGEIKRLDGDDAVVFTYLPTSFKFGTVGLPFLVNANFITDAGRQQLRKDSEWNKLIFSKIPSEYLKWVSQFSSELGDYHIVLPKKSYGDNDPLEIAYSESMVKALSDVAFIPPVDNEETKIHVCEALIDRIGLSLVVPKTNIVNHINKTSVNRFKEENFIENKGITIFREYGVYMFESKHLCDFFIDKDALEGIDSTKDSLLITFLYDFYSKIKKQEEQEELYQVLRETSFILGDDENFLKPTEIYFPSNFKENNKLANNSRFIDNVVYSQISSNYPLIQWLRKLGVQELSDESFIRDSICSLNFITIENSIEITRYLYQLYKKGELKEDIVSHLRGISFLSKQGNLKKSNELFFGSIFSPEIDIESVCDKDIYVSEEYVINGDYVSWRMFLTLLGINASFKLTRIKFESQSKNEYVVLDDAWTASKKIIDFGYSFQPQWFLIEYYPLISIKETSHDFAKVIWSYILSKAYSRNDASCIRGHIGDYWSFNGYDNSREPSIISLVHRSIREFILREKQLFPTTTGGLFPASEIYLNTEENKSLAGRYFPVLDINGTIESSWQNLLPFKHNLSVTDLLDILAAISNEDVCPQDQERICKIYDQLVNIGVLENTSNIEIIKTWSSNNRILSTDNEFVSPSELKHITLDGFSAGDRVYISSCQKTDKVIKLLEYMGVKVITEDNIEPDFVNSVESTELHNVFSGKLPLIALIAAGTKANETTFNEKLDFIKSRFADTCFYHCEKISLTYGNRKDVLNKISFGNQNSFYYTGSLRPSSVEPLLESLCKFFGITGHERDLFIIMVDTYDGICENLEEKGYNIDLIPKDQITDSGTISVNLGGYKPTQSEEERNRITGFKGEIFVYEELKKLGYSPICPSIADDSDYEYIVTYKGKTYYCKNNYSNYDIELVTPSGKTIYVEVKTTTRSKTSQENMPISYNELSMIETCDNSTQKTYLIARVFSIDSETPTLYLFKGSIYNGNIEI